MLVSYSVTWASEYCPLGMISYWQMEEDAAQSGFLGYLDETEFANIGVCSGTCPVITTAGMVNNAQEFNGTSSGIRVAASTVYDWGNTDSFGIELWMRRGTGISSREILIGRDDSTTSMQWYIGIEASGEAVFFVRASNGSSQVLTGTKRLDNGIWHHIYAVRDGNLNRLFVDGQEEAALATVFTAGFESTVPVTVGYLNENDVPTFHYNGLIDEVAIYDRHLDERFRQAHYYLSNGYCSQYDNPVAIMPLGDSITYDDYVGDTRPTSERIAYRKTLWESLDADEYWFDFVGSLVAGNSFSPPFDPDNEGHPGFRDADIASQVYAYLSGKPADVVLLHIGTNNLENDPNYNDPNNVENILDEIDRFDENITVLLARIIERVGDDGRTNAFNDAVETMADSRIADGDKIVMVDMEDGAGLDYTIGVDMIDTLHPNASGYDKMADKWFWSLETILLQYAPPEIVTIPNQTIDEGSQFTDISLDAYVDDHDDPDSDIVWTCSGNSALSLNIVNRVVSISINDEEWNSSETITFRATDPGGLFNEHDVTFTVNAQNDQPLIHGSEALSTDKNVALVLTLGVLTVVDPDNTYPDDFSLTVYEGANYTRTGITITPDLDFVGTLTVPVSVNDGQIESNSIDLLITVIEETPQITSEAPTEAIRGEEYTYLPSCIKKENDTLSWSLINMPEGMRVNETSGKVSWIPGKDVETSGQVTLIVEDSHGDSDSENFIVTVNDDDSGGGGGGSSGCFIQSISNRGP